MLDTCGRYVPLTMRVHQAAAQEFAHALPSSLEARPARTASGVPVVQPGLQGGGLDALALSQLTALAGVTSGSGRVGAGGVLEQAERAVRVEQQLRQQRVAAARLAFEAEQRATRARRAIQLLPHGADTERERLQVRVVAVRAAAGW